ncbi:MAG: hypothetical protein ACKVQW_12960 [Pyrinomonadaceae bacterium]
MTFDKPNVLSQGKSTASPKATPTKNGPDFGKYGLADYNEETVLEPSERERRNRTSKRYDNEGWVTANPHPETAVIGRVTENEPPPVIPTDESELIVTGKVVKVTAHLSNDKGGVYSEFTVKVGQILKNNLSIELERDSLITLDRAGGVVRYPNGQEVLYEDSQRGLPEEGREYAFFLCADKKSENYKILTLYDLQETKIVPLDSGRAADDIKRMGKSDFLQTVRGKLSQPKDRKP